MKQITILLSMLLITTMSFAHYITPFAHCSTTNKTTLDMTIFTIGHGYTAHFYATSNNKKSGHIIWELYVHLDSYTTHNLNDSVGAILHSGFYVNVPASLTEVFGEENDGWSGNSGVYNSTVLTNTCISLPVVFGDIMVVKTGHNYVITWTTNQESNADHFIVEGSTDAIVWDQLATQKTYWPNGNGNTEHTYFSSLSLTTNASISSLFILFFLIGAAAFLARLRIRRITLTIIGLLFMFSCSKTITFTPTVKNYKYFRILEVDKDGNTMNSKVVTTI